MCNASVWTLDCICPLVCAHMCVLEDGENLEFKVVLGCWDGLGDLLPDTCSREGASY